MNGNNMSMRDFYEKVIDDFGRRLYNKFNNKEPGFDTERIDQIKNVISTNIQLIKQKMDNPRDLFKDALEIKHSSTGPLIPEMNHRRSSHINDIPVKKEEREDGQHHDEEDDYLHLLRNH